MEEIQVGEYIRTKNGNIGKVIDIDKRNYWIDRYIRKESGIPFEFLDKNSEQLKNNIIKHSKILAEVIEVGDYINGKRIHKIDKGKNYCYLYYENCKTFANHQIETIWTKEQLKSIEYDVGGLANE